ncbi:5-methyltetrahydropteroyltriglutamate--homocysteine S-methyltransferase [Limnobacter litoralis]|uniref:5-methyltetrahydropteroyltriglutamate--homocysteine methyltransferase n=1 Tax=Limnobacter litoralis TaxID=481366 RepID=A0ABQ5YST4_9BURK|nr:5-methyltetrahydropteroyltriglutamate--homocysteine S-methyltransferase [Limnobacter litoralis]GLR26445.1 5-methyltetrahydropteroyltriglutamate--homocysteine methyltransferase [Limnobacter litoralis]
MIKTHIAGYPRIGAQRELKFALEKHWRGEISQRELLDTATALRLAHWQTQIDQGLDFITVGDFSLYDHVADHIALFGCIPPRFRHEEGSPLDNYFHMVRGKRPKASQCACHADTFALEMTKWFDTNYHYMVPEFDDETRFNLHAEALLDQLAQAKLLQHPIKITLIGPITLLLLGKSKQPDFEPLNLLDALVDQYTTLLGQLKQAGAQWVQLDEPVLGLDLPASTLALFDSTYNSLKRGGLPILLGTYFSELEGHISQACKLPVDGLHLDCVRGLKDLPAVLDWLPNYKVLSLGLVDGRNIWKTDLEQALKHVTAAFDSGKNEVWLSSNCSLLHCPYTLADDTGVLPAVRNWLSGAIEKLGEIELLKQAANALLHGKALSTETATALARHQAAVAERHSSNWVHKPAVKARVKATEGLSFSRQSPFKVRRAVQQQRFNLPAFPTTTIGSFPQTADIRALRKRLKAGLIDQNAYDTEIRNAIADCIQKQEVLGLDVLVHGEPERNDMVEFFGERLDGFAFSANGWVQSYGSRCVKPPILYGDVSRPAPMTVDTSVFAQSLSKRPVKGMLTGPVTILQWSFVRDDQARSETAKQIALAIADEVIDLECAGIGMIQIDEPAYREGLPLRKKDQAAYLDWATLAFRISACGVKDETQIHTHMCYAEFNDILPNIAAMDADVITIETSRSDMELLRGFGEFSYPNDIGPGVYDIHSPRVPAVGELVRLMQKAAEVIDPAQLWINPDCGLKTRGWPETLEALHVMMQAAKTLRTLHQNVKLCA